MAFRGVSGTDPSAEFVWEGADGNSVLFYRLLDETAYWNFFYKVRKPQLTGAPFDLDRGCADLVKLIESEHARSNTGMLLLMDGMDHAEILPELPALLDRVREVMPQVPIVHSRLEDFRHAIRFTANSSADGYIWPARHKAPRLTTPNSPPMGACFRLKASVDISGYDPQIQVIFRAFKEYGLILADNGSNWYISGEPDAR